MKPSSIASSIVGAVVAFAIVFAAGSAAAQVFGPERWFTDRPADVKEPPAGPAPRTADGHPDLSGVWWPGGDVAVTNLPVGESRAPSGPPRQDPSSPALYASLYKPEPAAKAKTLSEKDDPALRCIPSVIGPHVSLLDQGYIGQVIQTPKFVVLLTETYHGFKVIPIDGRGHRDDVAPSYRGDSVGRWDGDTLVVDTTNFNDQNWILDHGNVSFHSDALHLVERYHLIDANHLAIDATVEDPKVLTQPWTVATQILERAPFDQIMEVLCTNTETANLLESAHKENYGRKP